MFCQGALLCSESLGGRRQTLQLDDERKFGHLCKQTLQRASFQLLPVVSLALKNHCRLTHLQRSGADPYWNVSKIHILQCKKRGGTAKNFDSSGEDLSRTRTETQITDDRMCASTPEQQS